MLKKVLIASLLTLTFTLPLFFLPTTLNFFTTNKQLLLSLTLVIILLTLAYHLFQTKSLPFKKTHLNLPLLLFSLAIIANLIFIPTGRPEALINQGFLFLALSFLTYLIASSKFSPKTIRFFIYTLITSGSLLALQSIFQILLFHQLSFLPNWAKSQVFTPTGSLLTTLTFLILTLVVTFTFALRRRDPIIKTLLFLLSGLQLASLVAYLTLVYQKTITLYLLPYRAGWFLTLDALKSFKSLILGIGLANFPSFFTLDKPLFLNQTKFWNLIPATSSTELLHLLTTTGLFGFLSFLSLLLAGLKLSQLLPKTSLNQVLKASFFTLIFLLIFLPGNLVILTLLFLTLGLIANQAQPTNHLQLNLQFSYLLAGLFGLLALGLTYFTYRVYAAEYYMRQAQLALQRQDAKATYNYHLKAIKLMPYLAAYHTSLSQIDLNLASGLSQKQNLSEEDKKQITALIQQAIAEAKTAIQLQPNNSGLWQNLALIYRNLINIAQNADQFALQYYAQAIKLDPANPLLHVNYGGLYYQLAQNTKDKTVSQKLLNQAIQQFQTAIQLKPNYANAYYNLAKAYELLEDYPSAYQAMQQVIANLDSNSPDYNLAKEELKKIEAKLPKQTQNSQPNTQNQKPKSNQLAQPSPLPSPLPNGPIQLPQESTSTPANH